MAFLRQRWVSQLLTQSGLRIFTLFGRLVDIIGEGIEGSLPVKEGEVGTPWGAGVYQSVGDLLLKGRLSSNQQKEAYHHVFYAKNWKRNCQAFRLY